MATTHTLISQSISDQSLGQLLLSSAAVTFVYYTVWTLVLVRGMVLLLVRTEAERCGSRSSMQAVPSMAGFRLENGPSEFLPLQSYLGSLPLVSS